MKKVAVSVLIISLFVILLSGCSLQLPGSEASAEREGFYMGTVITLKAYGSNAEKASDEVMDRMREIEGRMTINAPGGDINKLNEAAGKNAVELNEDTIYVLEKAKQFYSLSNGAFDITIGPLVKAWGVFTDNPRIPGSQEITELKGLEGCDSLSIDESKSQAMLSKPGQIVDLGGIAKGYGGDEAVSIYKKYGVKSAMINLGGNMVVLGKKADGSLWKIGIQDPRDDINKYIGILSVSDKAVVTSGDYERYFERDGKRYHHIIDPKTGYPSDSGLISTTIVCDLSVDADALSTSTFILGLEKGMGLVESLPGVEAVFITGDRKVYVTEGLKDIFTFTGGSGGYEYVEKR